MKKALLVLLVLILAAGIFLRWQYPQKVDAGIQVVSGKSPHCPFPLAIEAPDGQSEQVRVKDAFIEKLRLGAQAEGYERWDMPERTFWIPEGNRWVLPFNLAEQERDIYQTKRDWGIREGDTVLDCGAHVGVFVYTALQRGAGKIIAIEPSPRNVECLRRNFANEIEAGRVVIYPKGVWNKDDTMVLGEVHDNSAADTVVLHQPGSEQGEVVPLTTIDKLVAELGLEQVDFIKMDIEGAEVPALQGAESTLRKWKPRMALASYHKIDDPVTIPATVESITDGYSHRCGSCIIDTTGVRPEVLLFHAPK